jgi:hypothetical protein
VATFPFGTGAFGLEVGNHVGLVVLPVSTELQQVPVRDNFIDPALISGQFVDRYPLGCGDNGMAWHGKYLALSAAMPSMVERLFRTIGREDMVDDPKFSSNEMLTSLVITSKLPGRLTCPALEGTGKAGGVSKADNIANFLYTPRGACQMIFCDLLPNIIKQLLVANALLLQFTPQRPVTHAHLGSNFITAG